MSLINFGFRALRPLLHCMDAETAHSLTIKALKTGLGGSAEISSPSNLAISCFGLNFQNPLGLAAGFDKNAEVPDAMLAMGFGFVEVGTVTPRPQEGNPRPRLFRLSEDRAVINRLGFNNEGHAAVLERLRFRKHKPGIVGVNIGANKESIDRISDYVAGIHAFSDVAGYFTINISSPNTPGLRNLQSAEELPALLKRLNEARQTQQRQVPMLLKIAPDLEADEMKAIAECCMNSAVDGVIISNTTVSRPALHAQHAKETGGLSGAPLFEHSTLQLARFYLLTKGKIPLVGVGGISHAEHAWSKICAGASLLQLYSALVFQGPELVQDILSGLSKKLAGKNFATLSDAVGTSADEIAHHSPPGK
ncbi:MAG: quinone-dependent dihydroorotate dehydrogenase [Aestuariivirga sp.]|nr:quinone-dependent dihydroorotate dehydrogenase [Aestuariivirga sp.]